MWLVSWAKDSLAFVLQRPWGLPLPQTLQAFLFSAKHMCMCVCLHVCLCVHTCVCTCAYVARDG